MRSDPSTKNEPVRPLARLDCRPFFFPRPFSSRHVAANALICLGLLLGGCHEGGAPANEAPAETGSADAQLDARVERELRRQPALREVAVSVRSGVVVLTGQVPHRRDRDRVETLVRRIEGVEDVRNDLSTFGVIDDSPRIDTNPVGS